MRYVMITVMALMIVGRAPYGRAAAQTPPIPSEEQPQVLTRGPINEAFAQPVNLDNQTGLVAPVQPPANIEEMPPAERPAGGQFAWVPGYWAWDSDSNGYIWVSGCWRAVPPGMSWVPGYWSQTASGWQWVAGFWAPAAKAEVEYLQAPPALTNVSPPVPVASPDRIWVPPCWYWTNGQYVLRPGYWLAAQADWVWVPSHYVWTPRGYVFVAGHWDYPLDSRGVLFAPVYFPRHLYQRPGFSYALSIAVNIGNLQLGLFTRPRYSHYYFGDYYDSAYINMGIFPWFQVEQRRTWYDPIYVHDRWRYRKTEPRWEQRQRQEYDRLHANKALRPPRTYREMESSVSRMPASQRRSFQIAEPMTKMAARKTTAFRFEQNKPEARKQLSTHVNDVHKFIEERSRFESQGTGRKTGQPARRQETVSEQKKMTPPVMKKGPDFKPAQRMQSLPAAVMQRGQGQERTMERSSTRPEPQRQSNVSQRGEKRVPSDKVRMRTSPVAGKQESQVNRKKRLPSKPGEEQKNQP